MGSWEEFGCRSCGYEVMVSGRGDAGFFVNTTTILCEDCEGLYDAVTFRRPGGPGAGRNRMGAIEPECPRSDWHTVRRWKCPGACPKCGNTMVRGEKVTIWD